MQHADWGERCRRWAGIRSRAAAPTLLLWGADDRLIERPVIDGLVGSRPDWHLRVFEGVGHLLPMEVPDAYATAVGEWVAPC